MPDDKHNAPHWPSDAEVDAALALLTPELCGCLQQLPLLMLQHRGRVAPMTLEGQRREAFRHWLGPLDNHRDSTAWDAPGNAPLNAIAAIVWPFYDQLVAAKAEADRKRQVLLDRLVAADQAPAVPAAPTPALAPQAASLPKATRSLEVRMGEAFKAIAANLVRRKKAGEKKTRAEWIREYTGWNTVPPLPPLEWKPNARSLLRHSEKWYR